MEAGRQTGRERLVVEHMPLVRSIARRYARKGESVEDLVQVGAIGLIKAVDRFDARRGTDLRAVAVPAIEGEIRHYLRDHAGTVRAPASVQQLARRARAARAALESGEARVPTYADVAAAVGADEEEVARALRADEPTVPLAAVDASAAPADPGDDRALVDAGLQVLTGRERRVIELRYYRDLRQADIARELGISQAQVSRVIQSALARMRAALAGGAPGAAPAAAPRRASAGHSGRLLLRMDPDLHRRLAAAAADDGLSLNAFIAGRLEQALAPPRTSGLLVANLVVVALAVVVGLVLLAGALAGAW